MRICEFATAEGCPARCEFHCGGEADQVRALEAAPEFAGKKVWTVSGGGLLGVAGGGAVALVFG